MQDADPVPAVAAVASTSASLSPPGSVLIARRPKRRGAPQAEDASDEDQGSRASNVPEAADAAGALVPAEWSLPFPAVAPRRHHKRRNPNGWGPFRSVVRERSVDFNLTLDVQQLQQEVQQLEAVRTALRFKTFNLRHAPDGSLMQTVREYFRLFRRGYCVHGDRPRLTGPSDGRIRESEQRGFIYSVMDEKLDCGNGLYGPQIMVEQITNYSTFLRYISFDLVSFDIVTAEDSVIITTYATLHFQILRMTIAMIFPHIMGNEALVARLVGQELAPVGKITFYFNAKDKCERYTAELDFAGLFFDLLEDPRDVDILMGRARIADNSMFAVDEADVYVPESPTAVVEDPRDPVVLSAQPTNDSDRVHEYCEDDDGHHDGGRVVEDSAPEQAYADAIPVQEKSQEEYWTADQSTPQAPEQTLDWDTTPESGSDKREWESSPPKSSRVSLASIVEKYFAVFAATSSVDNHGYIQPIGEAHEQEQWEFLSSFIASDARCGLHQRVGPLGLLSQWQALRAVFHVASFRQVAPNAAMYDPAGNSFVIRTVAEYRLQCTPRTIEVVFPHMSPQSSIVQLLLTQQLVVEADLAFYMAESAEKVTRLTERMGLDAAIASIVPDSHARALLLSGARVTKDFQLAESIDGRDEADEAAQFRL